MSAAPKVPDAEAEAVPRPGAGAEAARAAGRGGLAIAGAKVSFILFGTAQQLILPRILGVDGYGQVSLVFGIVSIVNNVVVATSIQGVSHAVSQRARGPKAQAFRATLGVHLVLAMILSAAFAALAGVVADLEKAPHVTAPLRLVARDRAALRDLRAARRLAERPAPLRTQAALDTGYGAMRMVAIALGALLFLRARAQRGAGRVRGLRRGGRA